MKAIVFVVVIMIGLGLGRCRPDVIIGPSCTEVVIDWAPVDPNSVLSNIARTVEEGQSIAGVDDAVKVTFSEEAQYLMFISYTDPVTDPHVSLTVSFDIYTEITDLQFDYIFARGFLIVRGDGEGDNDGVIQNITANQWNTITYTAQQSLFSGDRNQHRIGFEVSETNDVGGIPADQPIYIKSLRFSYSCQ